jgi:hypothetical protein
MGQVSSILTQLRHSSSPEQAGGGEGGLYRLKHMKNKSKINHIIKIFTKILRKSKMLNLLNGLDGRFC